MCEYCHSYPHMHGCPNEPEPKSIGVCKYCGQSIAEGEDRVELDEINYHLDCFQEAAAGILINEFGARVTYEC